jgi:flagellar basal body-associated protein FliL
MSEEQAVEQPTKGGGMKTILFVAALRVVEAVAVFGVIMVTMGSSSSAQLAELEGAEENDLERPVEVEFVRGKFQNMSTGRVWQWEVHVFLKVRNKNVERVEAEKLKRVNEIEEGISRLIRSAQDRHLREAGLETITRQITQYVNDVFGHDPNGIPRVERVIIPKCMGAPMDF